MKKIQASIVGFDAPSLRVMEKSDHITRQSNHIDCDVFALYFINCVRSGFTIKSDLTLDEIQNYRRKSHVYLIKAQTENNSKRSAEWSQKTKELKGQRGEQSEIEEFINLSDLS